jgi:hypothetical protein
MHAQMIVPSLNQARTTKRWSHRQNKHARANEDWDGQIRKEGEPQPNKRHRPTVNIDHDAFGQERLVYEPVHRYHPWHNQKGDNYRHEAFQRMHVENVAPYRGLADVVPRMDGPVKWLESMQRYMSEIEPAVV